MLSHYESCGYSLWLKSNGTPGTLLAPVPVVLVSCGSMEQPNVLTVAWTGILSSDPPKTYVSVRPSRFSYALIKASGEFVINLPSSYLIRIVDFCGVKSGRDIQKFEVCNLTVSPSAKVSAPSVAECPVSLECRVTDILPARQPRYVHRGHRRRYGGRTVH